MKPKPITPYEHLRREYHALLERIRSVRRVSLFFFYDKSVEADSNLRFIKDKADTAARLGFDLKVVARDDGGVEFVAVQRV